MAAAHPPGADPAAGGHVHHHAAADAPFSCTEVQCDTAMHGEPGCCGVGHCAVTLAATDAAPLHPPPPVAIGLRLVTPVRYGVRFRIERPPKRA